jgi:hypothetical protein
VVVNKNVAWNALNIIVTIDHSPYWNTIRKYCIVKQSFQAHFEFEFYCLNKCLEPNDLFLDYESNNNSFEDPSLRLQKTLR